MERTGERTGERPAERTGERPVERAAERAPAERAVRGLGDWLATMSHELRTPLNAIIGYADLMLLGLPHEIPVESKAQVDRMRLAARHLLGMLDEILTFASVEAGQESVRAQPVQVAQVLREAAAQVEPLAVARGLRVAVALPVEAPTLLSDATKLRQILAHLASNAVASTTAGTVTLAARGERDAVVFEVRDTGAGIAPEDLPHLFDPFRRLTSEPTQASPNQARGTGLGLAIARHLTQLLGGEITVRSRQGIGSTFAVRVPLRRKAAPRGD